MRIKAEVYAEELRKRNGLDKALQIATMRMKESSPNNWQHLPPVFFQKDRRGNKVLPEKRLKNLHNWWTHVFYILKKK
jgi:hypothetical protein